jgi:hypothetical protein
VKNEGTGKLSIQLEQEKENDGPGMGQLGFVLEFVGDPIDPDSVTLSPQDASLVPELRKHARLWQQLEWYLEETATHRLEIDSIPIVLGLNDSQKNTLRNYVWALKNHTGKYKLLAQKMHVDEQGKYLCLNTTLGQEDGYHPEEASSLIETAIGMGGRVINETDEEPSKGVTI